MFLGNTVVHIAVKHILWKTITARFVRFAPKSYIDTVCMRVEVYGRKATDPDPGKLQEKINSEFPTIPSFKIGRPN